MTNQLTLSLELPVQPLPLAPADRLLRVLSYGGGLDSFAMLVWSIRMGCAPDVVVMCDVGAPGDLGEWPSTYRHVDEIVRPLCARHGIPFVMITGDRYPVRGERSLWAYFEKTNSLPGRMSRLCTNAAKVERFARWANDHYAGLEIEVWVGFEAGEEDRAAKDPHGANAAKRGKKNPAKCTRVNRFPLIEWGFCRCRCEALVREAGYPVPRKSACVFCPFSALGDFKTLASELPAEFERIAAHEERSKLTESGHKLRYFAFGKNGKKVGLPVVDAVARPYKRRVKACSVCGAAERATKATGCDYLETPELAREAA